MQPRRLLVTAALFGILALGCGSEITQPLNPSADTDAAVLPSDIPRTAYSRASGGGQMREGHWKISFAGQATGEGDLDPTPWAPMRWMSWDPDGQWVVQFHNVSEPLLSGATFKSSDMMDMAFSLPHTVDSKCVGFMALTAVGRLNGEPGWVIWFSAADVGKNKSQGKDREVQDHARVVLWAPGDHPDSALKAFDSDEAGFPRASICGGKKTGIDSGNLKIKIWY